MHKPSPLYAEAAKHAPAHIARWENEDWGISPGLRKTASILSGLLLLGILVFALSCTTIKPERLSTAGEHATPLTAAK